MEGHPQLLSLIPKGIKRGSHEVSEDKRLELKLGPPGENHSLLSLPCYLSSNTHFNKTSHGAKRGFQEIIEAKIGERNWLTDHINQISPFVSKSLAVMGEDSSQPCNSRVAELQRPEKACSTPNCPQKRIEVRPVVGWPPVGSFRKNVASSSCCKLTPELSKNRNTKAELRGGKSENMENSLLVKINMDGVPIGRKVDLKAFDNYEKLSTTVDQLFRGLLAAQGDSPSTDINEKGEMEKTKAITGLLDGKGEYSLVYEDNEGDRMLVGDVPWHMFISSAKRLRVLKRSELSAMHLCSSKPGKLKAPLDSAVKTRYIYK